MTSTARRTTLLLAAVALIATQGQAQEGLTVKQKTTYSLGRLGGGDLTETVQLAGDRQKTTTEGRVKVLIVSRDASATSIVRLDEGNVYTLDPRRRRYQVVSLPEVRAQMERTAREMEAGADVHVEDDEMRMWIEAEPIRRTGERRLVNGFDTEQTVVKLTVMGENRRTGESGPVFFLTGDIWVDASHTAAARLSHQFAHRWAEALGVDPRSAGNPFARWLKELYQASESIDGYAILSEFRMEAPAPERPPVEARDASAATDPVGAVLGGLARRATRGRQEAAGPVAAPGRSLLFHSTTEVTSIQTGSIPAAEFEVPQGFRQSN
jgi:hypothetical protein